MRTVWDIIKAPVITEKALVADIVPRNRRGSAFGWYNLAIGLGLGVHPQSEGFTRLQEWDFENTPPEAYPLLLNYLSSAQPSYTLGRPSRPPLPGPHPGRPPGSPLSISHRLLPA